MNIQTIKYYSSRQLLEICTLEPIGSRELIPIIKNLPDYFKNNLKLNVLLDFSATEVTIIKEELTSLAECLIEVVLPKNSIRIAKIVSKPKDTALAFLFRTLMEDKSQIEIEIFSTRSAALKWLSNLEQKCISK